MTTPPSFSLPEDDGIIIWRVLVRRQLFGDRDGRGHSHSLRALQANRYPRIPHSKQVSCFLLLAERWPPDMS